jgi:immediate early response 3-interacting protein 1
MLFLGGIFYIGLLLINAVAVLSEDRFLARSACPLALATPVSSDLFPLTVGWSTIQPPNNVGFQQNFDHSGGYGNPVQDIGMKGRLINLMSAVRTVMQSMCHFHFVPYALQTWTTNPKTVPLIGINIVVIIYELILGK